MRAVRVAAVAAGCVAVLVGCSSDKPTAGKPTKSCDQAIPECLPTAKTSFIPVPAVTVGQPFRYQVPTENGAADLEITVTSLKTRPGTSSDPRGSVTLCVGVKVRNVGTVSVDANDSDAQTIGKWFGLDGQQAEANPGTMQTCDPRDQEWGGAQQPAPLPGKYVSGVWMYNVPDRPGALEVTDSSGHPLYRVDYGPKSAQVPMNAVGQ